MEREMLKILCFVIFNVIALILSSISLVSTAAMMQDAFTLATFMKLGIYLGILIVGIFFYKLGVKLFQTV